MKNLITVTLVICLSAIAHSQTYTGKLTDATTHLPVPYAAIYSKNLGIGVYSNEDGKFLISSAFPLENENLVISCVGYKSQTFHITGPDCGVIKLKPIAYKLKEVQITGNDAENKNFKYLDSLFQIYRGHSININSKAYFSFSAEEDTIPLEFQEMYYNAVTSCRNGIEELNLKTGRVGNNQKNFLTLNVSDIFLSLKMFSLSGNLSIPQSPPNYRYRNMKKLFQFTTVATTPEKDKFLMVLEPRTRNIPCFSLTLFIDKTKNIIEKVEYSLKARYFYYFFPLMPRDTVRDIDLKLVYIFDNQDDPYHISQAGISYKLNYYSSSTQKSHFIEGSGKLIIFEPGKQYPEVLPADLFKGQNNDYRLISSLPYDSIFWNIPGISPLSTKDLKFLDFFNIGKLSETLNTKIQEASLSRYMPWRKSPGVAYSDFDSISLKNHQKLKNDDYLNFSKNSIKTSIVLNYFYLSDSLHLTSATMIDLVDSWFEKDTLYKMISFINLSFDLAEVYRRKMIDLIYSNSKFQHPEAGPELRKLYVRLNLELADTLSLLKKQTENGSNLEMLVTWINHMKNKHKIDRCYLADLMYYQDLFVKGKVVKGTITKKK